MHVAKTERFLESHVRRKEHVYSNVLKFKLDPFYTWDFVLRYYVWFLQIRSHVVNNDYSPFAFTWQLGWLKQSHLRLKCY